MTVNISIFMQRVIDRIGRQPDKIDGNSYIWLNGHDEIELVVGDKMADIEVELHVNKFALDENDSYYHRYELTDEVQWNGMGIGTDGSMWTYNELIETLGCQVAATIDLG